MRLLRILLAALALVAASSAAQADKAYVVYPNVAAVKCSSDAICASIPNITIQSVTLGSVTGSANYHWDGASTCTNDGVFCIIPTGATHAFVMDPNTAFGNTYARTASIAALEAYGAASASVAHAALMARLVGGSTGSGDFDWVSGNQAANVTADPGECVWVAPSNDLTGASGAWERKLNPNRPLPLSDCDTAANADAFAASAGLWWDIDIDATLSAPTTFSAPAIGSGGILHNGTFAVTGSFYAPPNVQMFDPAATGLITNYNSAPTYPTWYGAVPQSTTANAAVNQLAVQAAIDTASASTWGTKVEFPCGVYHHNATWSITSGNGGAIDGQSRGCVRLIQDTNNTGQIQFNQSGVMFGWEIGNLFFDWNTTQSTADTSANSIYLTGTNPTYFNFKIHDIQSQHGYGGVVEDRTTSVVFWDSSIKRIEHWYNYGPVFDGREAITNGQSNNVFEQIDARCSLLDSSTYCMYLQGCGACTMTNMNLADLNQGNGLLLTSSSIEGDVLKLGEHGTGNLGGFEFNCTTSTYHFKTVSFGRVDMTGSGHTLYGLYNYNCTGRVDTLVGNTGTTTSNSWLADFNGGTSPGIMTIGNYTSVPGTATANALFNYAGNSPNYAVISEYGLPNLSTDAGNADSTWTAGTSQFSDFLYNSPVTAARYVNITASYNFSGNACITVTRTAAATGAFAIGIKNPAATVIASIAAAPASGSVSVTACPTWTGAGVMTWYQTH